MSPLEIERPAEGPTKSHSELDTLPSPLILDDFIAAQRADLLLTTFILRQSAVNDGAYFEDRSGLLRWKHHHDTGTLQIVAPEPLRSRLQTLMYYVLPTGHPGSNKMYYALRQNLYCLHVAKNTMATGQSCLSCAQDLVRVWKHLS